MNCHLIAKWNLFIFINILQVYFYNIIFGILLLLAAMTRSYYQHIYDKCATLNMYMFCICTINPTTSSSIYRSFCYCRRFDTLFTKWKKLIKKIVSFKKVWSSYTVSGDTGQRGKMKGGESCKANRRGSW